MENKKNSQSASTFVRRYIEMGLEFPEQLQGGVVTLKNNGKYALGTVSLIASSIVAVFCSGLLCFRRDLKKGTMLRLMFILPRPG